MFKPRKRRRVYSVCTPSTRVRSRGLLRYLPRRNENVEDIRRNEETASHPSTSEDEGESNEHVCEEGLGADREFPCDNVESESEMMDERTAEKYDDNSTFESVVHFLKDVQGMTREHQDRMLRHIKAKHNSKSDFPSNLYFFDKMLEPHYMATMKHYYCLEHGNYVGHAAGLCGTGSCGSDSCQLNLTGKEEDREICGAFFTISVRESLKMYFESVVGHDVFVYRRPANSEGRDFDLFDGIKYEKMTVGPDDVSLTFHVDDGLTFGINGSKNGSTKMLSFIINELPSRKRYRHRFLHALAVGKSHPPSQMLMDFFSSEVFALEKNGLDWTDDKGTLRTTYVKAPLFNSDAQARWDALGLSSFHAEHGCTTCFDSGMKKEGSKEARKYPAETHMKLRTRRSVIQCAEQALRKGVPVFGVRYATRLLRISSFCPVRGSTHDYMHCVALGVVKTGLMTNWCKLKKITFPFASQTANTTELIVGEREERIVDQRMKHFRYHISIQTDSVLVNLSSKF
ncbi:hypothetical protein RvY_19356-2 [Ramazzottius varieornatus]|uniref:Uncharacterized protein n=1 Tax=Ramazzottius varieornatus TaxID=947166 RepID=A0A1D1WC87_RAMVA|nr:hypothetical protein RvY_19356-2 [Ramazzottius varieornatus]